MALKNFFSKPIVLLLFSACLSALPLTFSDLYLISWVSFVPFFYVIVSKKCDKFLRAVGRGFLFGFVFHVCVYYWFLWFYPIDYVNLNSAESIAVVCLAWLGISVVHGFLWCIPFVCCHFVSRITKNSLFIALVAVLGCIAAQKATALGELSFPWARVSLGQYKATALIQSAWIWGIDGVDMLILLVNALLVLALLYKSKRRLVAVIMVAVLFFGNLGFGIIKINQSASGDTINILTAQASVPTDEKWASNGDKICLDAYTTLTQDNVTDDVDLILWPESAVPKIYKNARALKDYKKFSKKLDTPILAGIILNTADGNTNNAILIDEDGVQTVYTKRKMVPFGEFMPYKNVLSNLFPMLTELNIIEDDYIAGNSSAIMSVGNNKKIGSVICFESIYPDLTRQSTLDGAEMLVELTNDSWLKDSPAMSQHLAHGVFRSVETGRYLVRSANSGISAVIDNHGNIKSTIDINEQGVIVEEIELFDEQTLYTKTGDILFPLFASSMLIWLIFIIIKKIKTADS